MYYTNTNILEISYINHYFDALFGYSRKTLLISLQNFMQLSSWPTTSLATDPCYVSSISVIDILKPSGSPPSSQSSSISSVHDIPYKYVFSTPVRVALNDNSKPILGSPLIIARLQKPLISSKLVNFNY